MKILVELLASHSSPPPPPCYDSTIKNRANYRCSISAVRRAEQKQPAAYSQSRGQTKAQGSNLFPVRWRPKWSDVKMEERRMESASNIQLHLSVDHNLKHVFMFYNSIWVLSIKTIPNGCVDGYILSISGRQQETEQQEQFHRMGNLCLTLPPRDLSLFLSLYPYLCCCWMVGRSPQSF